MLIFLYALVVILSLLLIGIILVQPSKSGGMGAAFGGVGESVFGAQASSHLTKATVILTAVFFVLTLVLAALIGHGWRDNAGSGVTELIEARQTATTPAAAPATAAPAAAAETK